MAKHGSVVIKHEPAYGGDMIPIVRDTTTVIFRGDLLSFESSKAVLMATAGDDATFCGVAASQHESGDSFPVTSYLRCQIEADVTSASYTQFDGLKYAAGSATVEFSLVDDGSADTIGWAAETKASASRLRIDIDVRALGKLFVAST